MVRHSIFHGASSEIPWRPITECILLMQIIKTGGDKVYTVFITKKSYPNEEDVTHLATTYVLEEIKKKLDIAKEGKHLIVFTPLNHEGWALI